MAVYVTDTHPLVWYATNTHRRLSPQALVAFEAAWRNEALIYVPAFVLWEIAMLLKVRRLELRESFSAWSERLFAQHGFALAAVDRQMIIEAYYYPFPDPFDSVITATAKAMVLPLITNDRNIHASRFVEIYW
jgi:PIN domain nuclease of toxin-antitoxin system